MTTTEHGKLQTMIDRHPAIVWFVVAEDVTGGIWGVYDHSGTRRHSLLRVDRDDWITRVVRRGFPVAIVDRVSG